MTSSPADDRELIARLRHNADVLLAPATFQLPAPNLSACLTEAATALERVIGERDAAIAEHQLSAQTIANQAARIVVLEAEIDEAVSIAGAANREAKEGMQIRADAVAAVVRLEAELLQKTQQLAGVEADAAARVEQEREECAEIATEAWREWGSTFDRTRLEVFEGMAKSAEFIARAIRSRSTRGTPT